MMKQRTLKNKIKVTGVGLHSGKKVSMTLYPAEINTGVVYVRNDLTPNVEIPVDPKIVKDTMLCTALINENGVKISTVEHISSALSAFGIDNVRIELDAPEIPIMDGSSAAFMFLLNEAGVEEQSANKKFIKIKKTVRVEDGDKWAEFRPFNGFRFSFKIDFDHPVIKGTNQELIYDLNTGTYLSEISRARTFGFLSDIEKMRELGLGLGGSLDSAIVVDDYNVLNPNGLRYSDEFVRHKVLDAIGDVYMSGNSIIGEMVAYKSGHKLNNMLVNALLSDQTAYEIVELGEVEVNSAFEGFRKPILHTA